MSKRCKRRAYARRQIEQSIAAHMRKHVQPWPAVKVVATPSEPSDGFGALVAMLCVTLAVPLVIVGVTLKTLH